MSFIREDITNNPLILKANRYDKKVQKIVKLNIEPSPLIPTGTLPLQTKSCILHDNLYKDFQHRIQTFEVRKDDIWIIGFPKSGTTWTQVMVWLLNNNMDYNLEKKTPIHEKYSIFEYITLIDVNNGDTKIMEYMQKMPSPRYFKTHLPVAMLPPQLWQVNPKIIHITRNPKDLIISWYHHLTNGQIFTGTFKDYVELFINDLTMFSPYHKHILDYWSLRNETNILRLNYEDMVNDHMSGLKKIMIFLNKNYSDLDLLKLKEHLSVKTMRKNLSQYIGTDTFRHVINFGNPEQFIRKGTSGTYLKEMPPDLIARIDDWSRKELANTDFKFSM